MLNKIIYLVIGISIGVIFVPNPPQDQQASLKSEILGVATRNPAVVTASPEFAAHPAPPKLTALAAFAYDLNTNSILFTQNFDEQLPIASLTKLMSALVVVKSANLDDTVQVRKEDIQVVGNNMGLLAGERITVHELLRGMLISSSNDAAQTLARFVSGSQENFVRSMNEEAKALGLAATNFSSSTGLTDENNFSTAHDLSKLLRKFLDNQLLSEIVGTKQFTVYSADGKIAHPLTSTNKLLLEDERVSGVKTGFTTRALGNLILKTEHDQNHIITIVLGSQQREEDSKNLLNWVTTAYRW